MELSGQGESQVDHGQFVKEFSKYSRRLYGYILSLTMNRDDAEEVFQATSIVLYQKYDQFEPVTASFYTWACRVAYLEVLYFRRTKGREFILSEQSLEILRDEALLRSDEFEHREQALEGCLKQLDKFDRSLIEERYYTNLSPKQIGEKLGRSTDAVYRSLTRVHGMLRRCVNRTLAIGG